jgi:phage-related minor tail protein
MGEKVGQLFEALKEKISQVVENIKTAVSEKFQAIKDGIAEKVQAAKETVTNIFEGIKSAIQSKVDAAKNAISNTFNNIKSTISNTLNAAKSTVTSVFDSIKSNIQSKIDGARSAVQNAINKIKSIMNFSWSLPKLKLPHISISGSFSINPPSVPKFGISWYAKGGVFDNPALFGYGNGQIGGLGEQGAEAIVPLEKNTKWLDRIAERLGAGQSAQIVLQVDGKTFAQTAVSTINDLTRQQGRLALNVM